MNARKFYRYLIIAFIAGLAGSVFLLRYASSWLTESSKELDSLRTEVAQLDKKREDLERAQNTLLDQKVSIEKLERVLPVDKDQARVVNEVYGIADQAGVTIDSITFPTSTLGTDTKPAPSTTTTDSTSTTSDQSATTTPKPTTKNVSQATPLKEIPGLQSIQLTLGTIYSKQLSPGSGMYYSELISFMKLIERNQRTMQIQSIDIAPTGSENGSPTFNLSIELRIFIRG